MDFRCSAGDWRDELNVEGVTALIESARCQLRETGVDLLIRQKNRTGGEPEPLAVIKKCRALGIELRFRGALGRAIEPWSVIIERNGTGSAGTAPRTHVARQQKDE